MAIDYPRLFADIGSFVRAVDRVLDMARGLNTPRPNLPALLASHEADLSTVTAGTPRSRFEILDGLGAEYDSFRDDASGWCDTLASNVDSLLTDRATVIDQLNRLGTQVGIGSILDELLRDMLETGHYVTPSVVSVSSVTADPDNQGNGQVFVSTRLDGFSSPMSGAVAREEYRGMASQIGPTQKLLWICEGDQFTGASVEGAEPWRLSGDPAQGFSFPWRPGGTGESKSILTGNAAQTIANGSFESWTDPSTPASWTIESGSVLQDTDPADVFRGSSSLAFAAGGGKISQSLPGIQPRRMYCATVVARATSASMTFRVEGTGYTASGEELQAPSLTSGFQQYAIFFLAPAKPPSNLKLSISVTDAAHVDSATFAPAVYIGGVATHLVAGASPWVTGDRLVATVTNDDAGRLQRFWRRHYKRQLPTTGTTLLADPPV